MQHVNEASFAAATNQGVVLVDFYADWCGPCRALSPVLEQLTGVEVVKVNVDESQKLAVQFNVASIPTLVFMKDGVEVDRRVGLVSQKALQETVDNLKS